ncbi:MAG: hypothetical protein R2734_07445 [Nocardioides sp.]
MQINNYALPILVQQTLDTQSANIDMISGATVTSVGYLQSFPGGPRPGGAVSLRLGRTALGAPVGRWQTPDAIRRARDGHAGLARAARRARRHRGGPSSVGEAVAELRWVDLVFSTWKPDSAVSRLGRGEITLADCPPAGRRGARARRARRAGVRRCVLRVPAPPRRGHLLRPHRRGQGRRCRSARRSR